MIVKRIGGQAARPSPLVVGRSALALARYVVDARSHDSAAQAQSLANYVTDHITELTNSSNAGEKVEFCGQRNMASDDPRSWPAQLAASAMAGRGNNDPVGHWVVSWRQDEHPDRAEVEATIDLFNNLMDADGLHLIWSVHSNTLNWHLHLAYSRANPATRKMRAIGGVWAKDRAQQFCALAAHQFGRAAEPNDLYAVSHDGRLFHRQSMKVAAEAGVPITRGKGERQKEQQAAKRQPHLAQLRTTIREAISWADLHDRLANMEASYRPSGSGAVIQFRDKIVKASEVGSECTIKKLSGRLGQFQPCPGQDHRDAFQDYQQSLRRLSSAARSAKQAAMARLRAMGGGHNLAAAEAAIIATFDQTFADIGAARISESEWLSRGQVAIANVQLPALIFPAAIPTASTGVARGKTRTQPQLVTLANGRAALEIHADVIIVRHRDDATVQQALAIAMRAWGGCRPTGDAQFIEQANRIARDMGLTIQPNGQYGPSPTVAAAPQPAPARSPSRPPGPPVPVARNMPPAATTRNTGPDPAVALAQKLKEQREREAAEVAAAERRKQEADRVAEYNRQRQIARRQKGGWGR